MVAVKSFMLLCLLLYKMKDRKNSANESESMCVKNYQIFNKYIMDRHEIFNPFLRIIKERVIIV